MRFFITGLRRKKKIEKSDLYNLDSMFDDINKLLSSNQNGNKLFGHLSDDYRLILDKKFKERRTRIKSKLLKNDEFFEKHLTTGNSYINLIWSVRSLNSIILASRLKPQKFDCNSLYQYAELLDITQDGLRRAEYNKKPVIVAQNFNIRPSFIILDGNHRVVYNHAKGNKNLSGYLMAPDLFTRGFVDSYFKTLYTAYLNLNLIKRYLSGLYPERELFDLLHPVINDKY